MKGAKNGRKDPTKTTPASLRIPGVVSKGRSAPAGETGALPWGKKGQSFQPTAFSRPVRKRR